MCRLLLALNLTRVARKNMVGLRKYSNPRWVRRGVHNFGTKMLVSSKYVLMQEIVESNYLPDYIGLFTIFFQALFLRTPCLLHTLHSIGKQAHFKSRPHFSRPSAFLRLLKPRDCWLPDYWSSGEKSGVFQPASTCLWKSRTRKLHVLTRNKVDP